MTAPNPDIVAIPETIREFEAAARFHRAAVRNEVVHFNHREARLARAKWCDEQAENLRQKLTEESNVRDN